MLTVSALMMPAMSTPAGLQVPTTKSENTAKFGLNHNGPSNRAGKPLTLLDFLLARSED